MTRCRLAGPIAIAFCLLAASAAADAATVSVTGGRLDYRALPGERNDTDISAPGGPVSVSDDNVPVTAGAGCSQVAPSFVTTR